MENLTTIRTCKVFCENINLTGSIPPPKHLAARHIVVSGCEGECEARRPMCAEVASTDPFPPADAPLREDEGLFDQSTSMVFDRQREMWECASF